MSLNTSDDIGRLLAAVKTIAVVGLSNDPMRPSYGVSSYMQQQGYRIITVNPTISEALGERSYPDLTSVPERIDLVNVFRRPEYVPAILDEAIRLRLSAIWLQEGVIHFEAASKARQAGMSVVMDRCILKEHRRRLR